MTLSDSFCVGRYRAEFLDLMRSGTVDIVFLRTMKRRSPFTKPKTLNWRCPI